MNRYDDDDDDGGGNDLLIFGLWKTKRSFSLSSTQSISLPMMLNRALLSISTLTPSWSTSSSNGPGLSTYSRWYASPLHPRLRTPILISWGSGWSSRARSCSTADGVSFSAAFRGRSLRLGAAAGLGFCASVSGIAVGPTAVAADLAGSVVDVDDDGGSCCEGATAFSTGAWDVCDCCCAGGRVSCTAGIGLAIDVSGMGSLRGLVGGLVFRGYGW